MFIVSILLYVFWAFTFIISANRLYEVLKYRIKTSPKDWLHITAMLLMPVCFYVDKLS
jgi:hypothetical protein